MREEVHAGQDLSGNSVAPLRLLLRWLRLQLWGIRSPSSQSSFLQNYQWPKGWQKTMALTLTQQNSRGMRRDRSPGKVEFVLYAKPKEVATGAPLIPSSSLAASKEEGSNFVDDDYNSLSINISYVVFSKEELLNLALKEFVNAALVEKAVHGKATFSSNRQLIIPDSLDLLLCYIGNLVSFLYSYIWQGTSHVGSSPSLLRRRSRLSTKCQRGGNAYRQPINQSAWYLSARLSRSSQDGLE